LITQYFRKKNSPNKILQSINDDSFWQNIFLEPCQMRRFINKWNKLRNIRHSCEYLQKILISWFECIFNLNQCTNNSHPIGYFNWVLSVILFILTYYFVMKFMIISFLDYTIKHLFVSLFLWPYISTIQNIFSWKTSSYFFPHLLNSRSIFSMFNVSE